MHTYIYIYIHIYIYNLLIKCCFKIPKRTLHKAFKKRFNHQLVEFKKLVKKLNKTYVLGFLKLHFIN